MLFWVFDSIQSVIKHFWIVSFPVSGSFDLLMIVDKIQNVPWSFWINSFEPSISDFSLVYMYYCSLNHINFHLGFMIRFKLLPLHMFERIKLHLKISWYDSLFLWFVSIFMFFRFSHFTMFKSYHVFYDLIQARFFFFLEKINLFHSH